VTKKTVNPIDSDLFRQTIGEVRAVKSDKVLLAQDNLPPKPYPKPQHHDLNDVWHDAVAPDIDTVDHEETLSFTTPGIQNNVLAKLRKGFFGLQAEIDLHGLNSQAAKQQLSQFLQYAVTRGYRCVHIIHGKGHRSSDSHPILKNHLNRWLRQYKDVLAFCSAPPRKGGAGAVYVLLKLSKDHPEKYGE
jgi:DNA-nicking Smr family endonuclease